MHYTLMVILSVLLVCFAADSWFFEQKNFGAKFFFEKKIGDKNFGDFLFEEPGGLRGGARFRRRPSVRRRVRQNPNVPNRQKRPSREKNETADDGGGCVSAALNGP